MKIIIGLMLFVLGCSLEAAEMQMAKMGQRFSVALPENSQVFKWSDPIANPVGIVRFEGPRKMMQSSQGNGKAVFNFYALKPGNAVILFRQIKGTALGAGHEVGVHVVK